MKLISICTLEELQDIFIVDKPKAIFCQSEKAVDVLAAVKNLKLDSQIVTFDDSPDVGNICSFNELLKKSENDYDVNKFK